MKEEKDSQLINIINPFESPVYGVARGLEKEGFVAGGYGGISRPKQLATDMVYLFKDRTPIKKNIFGFEYNQELKAFDLGTLWINRQDKGAVEGEKWVLEIKKSKYKSKLTKVVEKLSSDYGVKLEIIPSDNKPGRATFLRDLC